MCRENSLPLKHDCESFNNLILTLGTLHFGRNFNSSFSNLPDEQNQKFLASFPLPQCSSYLKLKFPFITLILFRVSFPWEAGSNSQVSSLKLYFLCGTPSHVILKYRSPLSEHQIQKATSFL